MMLETYYVDPVLAIAGRDRWGPRNNRYITMFSEKRAVPLEDRQHRSERFRFKRKLSCPSTSMKRHRAAVARLGVAGENAAETGGMGAGMAGKDG